MPQNKGNASGARDITKVTEVPEVVLSKLRIACYDCHSNNTRYPWYNNIQPVNWWLNRHVANGREKLNFSEFGMYGDKKAARKLKGIAKTIEEGEMPLKSYTLIHRDAILTKMEKEIMVQWARTAKVHTGMN
jgi:hypothetical protein